MANVTCNSTQGAAKTSKGFARKSYNILKLGIYHTFVSMSTVPVESLHTEGAVAEI